MASGVFSCIQSLSSMLLQAIPFTSADAAASASSVKRDLEKLSRMLLHIEAVLMDAEEREIHDKSVRLWLAELRGVAYQAEDVLDEFHYELLRSIVQSGRSSIQMYHNHVVNGTKRKFSEIYTSSSLASFSSTVLNTSIPDGMPEKIKDITEMFVEIADARRDLHLRAEDGARLATGPQIRPPTSSHVTKGAIFGRNAEKLRIISLLDPANGLDFMVLPIVGMGGVGKTTLAQLVYNDSKIRLLFSKRCWLSVSDDFNLVRLTKAITDSICGSPCESSELSQLQDVLKEKIKDISLFLVLDDVWNDKQNLWERFRAGLFGAKTVRILTTTRNTLPAKIMQTISPFELGSLPEENCWSLFKHFAFGNREANEYANLHKIGRSIVKKCKGLPLAVKALGGILRYEMHQEKWKEILDSDISEIDETGYIMPELWLSYHKLPLHLRPCFLYLSIFPKGTAFEKDTVVKLWMAQGYINGNPRNSNTLEEMGNRYFDELQGRSLINRGLFCKYFLHDLIHDLASSICREANQPVLEIDQNCKVYHLYLTKKDELLSSLPPSRYCSIRTFVKECPSSRNFDCAIFSEIACVRALMLRYSFLPSTLGTLKHLRYLSVGDSQVEKLPETLCLLYHLQTLDLNCFNLRELPENINNLINLQYLQLKSGKIERLPISIFLLCSLYSLSLRYCEKLKQLPMGIEQLTRLRVLDLPISLINLPYGIGKLTALKPLSGLFSVMDHGIVGGLGELKDMNELSGWLLISGLKNIGDVEQSSNANLTGKAKLHKLILNFQECRSCIDEGLHLAVPSGNNATNKNDEKIQEFVLETLQPHGNLKELKILHYGGVRFPSWLLNSLLPNLTVLTLNFCTEPNFLPPFGKLRYLKFLIISGGTSVRDVRDEFSTYSLLAEYDYSKQPKEVSYPSLEVLSLRNMLNLVEWRTHEGDFPSLKKLSIENCPQLVKFSTIPQEVRMMLITECGCHELQFSFTSKIRSVLISHCPNLISVHSMGSDLPSLAKISVHDCPRMCKFLSVHKLMALKSISLDCCPELFIFPAIPEELEMLKIQRCGFREIMLPSKCGKLIVSNCTELVSINWRDDGRNTIAEVTFEYCPKLQMLTVPAKIAKLKIHDCGFREIVLLLTSLNLYISHCIELMLINWNGSSFHSVKEVSFKYCPKLKCLKLPSVIRKLEICECGFREIMFGSISENVSISNCLELNLITWVNGSSNSIIEVSFEYCPKLELVAIPVGISKLNIHECGFRKIIFPSVSDNLKISNCLELASINWRDEVLNSFSQVICEYCPKLKLLSFPSVIKKLKILECGFEKLILRSISESISISNCLELNSFNWSDGGLNSTGMVTFKYCPKLELLTVPVRIRKMSIHECGFHEITFQSSPEYLIVSNCQDLMSVTWRVGHLSCTEEATFEHCSKLTLPTIPTGIKKLKIAYCAIQEISFSLQSSIQFVDISYCQELTSINLTKTETHKELFVDCSEFYNGLKNLRISHCPIVQLPVKNLLHSATHRVEIYDCPRMDVGKRYVYQRDPNTTELNLFGNEEIHLSPLSVISTIPLVENSLTLFLTNKDSQEVEPLTCATPVGVICQCIMLNLNSLVILELSRCKRVISVTGLDNLSSLKRLSISYCPGLCDWKDKRIPPTLIFLELESCDKLSSLPLLSVENHPSILKVLVIRNCPILTILEGFHGLMNLKTVEILHCRNMCIAPTAESEFRSQYITLGDCSLMKEWFQRNNITYKEIEVVVPRYARYKEPKKPGEARRYKVAGQDMEVAYYHAYIDGVDFVFLDNPIFRHVEQNIDGGEQHEIVKRMILLCKAAVEVPWHVPCGGVCYGDGNLVFIANDWHTALLPVYLKAYYRDKGFMIYARSVLVIHNIAHQGRGPVDNFSWLDLPGEYMDIFKLYDPVGGDHCNIFAAGIKTADRLLTVSHGYDWELKTSEGGWGLHSIIKENDWKFQGIVNGIDTTDWNPKLDVHLKSDGYMNYSLETLAHGKAQCKAALQRELGLPINPEVPIIGFIGRLDNQKGVNLIADAMHWIVSQDVQLIMLGSGRSDLEDMLRRMEGQHHDRVRGWVGFSVKMAHRITAGADILLMPSRFEPCGLNQLYAMMYGTVPVVHAVGGLRDTVQQFDPYGDKGLGWTFDKAEAGRMIDALGHCLNTYRNFKSSWEGLQRRGMMQDLSWDNAAKQYEEVLVAAKYQW